MDDYNKLTAGQKYIVDNLLSNQATDVRVYFNDDGSKYGSLKVEWKECGRDRRTIIKAHDSGALARAEKEN